MRPTPAGRERRGQRGGRVLLALVRFVEDRDVVGRQQAAAGGEVEEEQRVVDDDDVGEARRVAAFEEMAVGEARAELADAVVGVGVERFPIVAARREVELGAVAGLGAVRPQPQLLHRRARRDEPLGAHLLVLLAAEVVVAALEQLDARRNTERVDDQRNVFAHELLLQRDRAGRDDDLLARAQRRHQIGQRFSDAGTGLDDRVRVLEDPALDQLRHLHLARTRFEARQRCARSGRAGRTFRRSASRAAGRGSGRIERRVFDRHDAGIGADTLRVLGDPRGATGTRGRGVR